MFIKLNYLYIAIKRKLIGKIKIAWEVLTAKSIEILKGISSWEEVYPKVMETVREFIRKVRHGKYLEKESWRWKEDVGEAVKNKKTAFKNGTRNA